MRVEVNGEPHEFDPGTTIEALLLKLAVKAPRVAVEVNAEVVRQARHALVTLHENDRVEIVTFVGGG